MAQPECINIRICLTTNVFISNNLLVRKNYFDSNIVWNENVRIMPCFPKDYFEADVDRSTCLHATSSRCKCKHFDISNVIYHKFSHGAASYKLCGENINVMLESMTTLIRLLHRDCKHQHWIGWCVRFMDLRQFHSTSSRLPERGRK